MPVYEPDILRNRVMQHQQDLMSQASNERMIREMKTNQVEQVGAPGGVGVVAGIPSLANVSHAWHTLVAEIDALVSGANHHLRPRPPRHGHVMSR